MSKEQIEEMAKVICNACEMGGGFDGGCALDNDYRQCSISQETAQHLYEKGYRKQEWISVKDRLPEDGETVLTINSEAKMEVCFYETTCEGIFQQCGGLVKIFNITHWMPLPEAPKMKGGAE